MLKHTNQQTFVIRLLDTQHKTWQGTITWLDSGRMLPFRSLLEMIKLMDSTYPEQISAEGAEKEIAD